MLVMQADAAGDLISLFLSQSSLSLPLSGTGKISLLSLLGFDSASPIAIFHDQLVHILSTLLIGISDPVIGNQINTEIRYNTITCTMMFDLLSQVRVGLSVEDYRTLKNFTCDFDPENFNVYTDLYMAQTTNWQRPTSKYRSYIASMFGDVYDLAKAITLTIKNNITIEPPFSKRYWDHTLRTLRSSLEHQNAGAFHKVNN